MPVGTAQHDEIHVKSRGHGLLPWIVTSPSWTNSYPTQAVSTWAAISTPNHGPMSWRLRLDRWFGNAI